MISLHTSANPYLLAIALLPWLLLAGCAAPWPMCDRAPMDRPTWNPYAPYIEVTACYP